MPTTIKATLASELGGIELSLPQNQNQFDKSLKDARSKLEFPFEYRVAHASSSFEEINAALVSARDIEELNFLAQLLEGMDEADLRVYGSIIKSAPETLPVSQLINIAYNLDELIIAGNIFDAESLGKKYVQNHDSKTDELILRNTNDNGDIDLGGLGMELHVTGQGLFTSIGYIQDFNRLATTPYKGECFPRYCYNGDSALGVSLHKDNSEEGVDIFLPASGSVLQRAMKRVGAHSLSQCTIKPIWGFPTPLAEMTLPADDIQTLNASAQWISVLQQHQVKEALASVYAAMPGSAQEYSDFILHKIRQIQQPDATNTITYYFPLDVKLRDNDSIDLYDEQYWADDLSPSEALAYTDDILAQLRIENRNFDTARLLAEHIQSDTLSQKVYSMLPTVEEHGDKLWGAMVMQVSGELTDGEVAELKKYIIGQNSDGYGEGFEQREIQTSNGELYVHFWSDSRKGYAVYTPEEFAALQGQRPAPFPSKLPDCPMVGADGNVFHLIGLVAKTLRKNGMSDAADEMRKRVTESGSYSEALAIMTEYVNPVSAGESQQSECMDMNMQ